MPDEKKQKVLQFFNLFIEDFIIEDLKKLILIEPNSETKLGGCTIPTAMTIISSIELIGFLLRKNAGSRESEKNISNFLNYDKEKFFPVYYDGKAIDKIIKYRTGMLHHFFPKFENKFAGICKDSTNSNLFICYDSTKQFEESLNVSVFAEDFLNAIKKVKHFLENTSEEELFDTILSGLKGLDYSLQNISLTTTCTTIAPGTIQNKRETKR